MKQSMKKESQELLKSRNFPDFSSLIIQDLTPLTKDIIINPNKLPEDDEVLRDLLTGQPDKKESLDAIGLRIIARAAVKAGKPIVYTSKPCQIAIGSTMEPTIHPRFTEFLQTVFETKVVPNYTTNGIRSKCQVCQRFGT